MKIHDGEWKSQDTINPLTSNDQYYGGNPIQLGMDAEVLPMMGGDEKKVLWPHEQKLPQERATPGEVQRAGLGTDRFDWHGDGFAHELCVMPAQCLDVMMNSIGYAFGFLNNKYKDHLKLAMPTVYEIPSSVRDAAPEEVLRLGCMPSLNVYNDGGLPESLGKDARTTGFHMHMSHMLLHTGSFAGNPQPESEALVLALVKWADILVGCSWTYVSPEDPSAEAARREAYGRAGEYRRPTYPNGYVGVEYRVLPGRVLGHPTYTTLMFNLFRTSLRFAQVFGEPGKYHSLIARTAINTADKKLAEIVVNDLPIHQDGKDFIKYLAKHPLPILTAGGWADKGGMCHGHRTAYSTWISKGKKGAD